MFQGVKQKLQETAHEMAGVTALAILLLTAIMALLFVLAFAIWHTIEPIHGSIGAWWWTVAYFAVAACLIGVTFLALKARRRMDQNHKTAAPRSMKSQIVQDAILSGFDGAAQAQNMVRQHPRVAVVTAFVIGMMLSRRTHLLGPLSRALFRIL